MYSGKTAGLPSRALAGGKERDRLTAELAAFAGNPRGAGIHARPTREVERANRR